MGAIPYAGGASFRIWAPHAERVQVEGSWTLRPVDLAGEDNGYWSVDAGGAKPGDTYGFLITYQGRVLRRNDPYARQVAENGQCAVIYRPDFSWNEKPFQMPSWNRMVIYELHIGTFNDRPGGAPGTLQRAAQKLPYLRNLGINAIEVMPPFEFAGSFSWGYNPGSLFAIENAYGGPDAFKAFIDAAHEHEIAVLLDVVYSHIGPQDNALWQLDGWNENDKGGIYFYNDYRSSTPWGQRFDYGRGEVRQYLRDNALMWLEEYRLDGLRWDATTSIRNVHGYNADPGGDIPDGWSLMQWINQEKNARQPWKISIAEDLAGNQRITQPVSEGGAGFDAQWDAHFVHPLRAALITPDDAGRNLYDVAEALRARYNGDAFERVIYTESHDEVANGKRRLPEEIYPGQAGHYYAKKRSTLGAALLFSAPGIPMLFQGQEFLENEWFRDQDPLDWSKAVRYRGILNLYRDLIGLRRNLGGNTAGLSGQNLHIHHLNNWDKLIAFLRWDQGGPGDSVVVVANFANRSWAKYVIGFPEPGLWKVRFNSDWAGYDHEFSSTPSFHVWARPGERDGLLCSGEIGIGPYTLILLSQDP